MPMYDFECTKCTTVFEKNVPFGELPKCPDCRSKKYVKKLPVAVKSYRIYGQNGASSTPKRMNIEGEERKEKKRERRSYLTQKDLEKPTRKGQRIEHIRTK